MFRLVFYWRHLCWGVGFESEIERESEREREKERERERERAGSRNLAVLYQRTCSGFRVWGLGGGVGGGAGVLCT